ncbi:MAG: hypothetical protein Q4F72_09410, partial [Desulfovibrionaceae bacterium]|nr:hypothetical protein [Desulfovibrionaceae bacterium]
APPQKGAYMTFSLRIDTPRIPAGVIRKHLTLALKKEKLAIQAAGKKYISKERKKEIKEQVILRLRKGFLPVPAEINVIWNTVKGEVWLASTQGKVIELFMQLFQETFGLHLAQLTPSGLAVSLLGDDKADAVASIQPSAFN